MAKPVEPPLVAAVRAAVAEMTWLRPSDQAMVALAVRYAQRIEDAAASGDEALSFKMAGWLGPHLVNTLKALGGAPAERKALGGDEGVGGRLASLRAVRGGDTAAVDSAAS